MYHITYKHFHFIILDFLFHVRETKSILFHYLLYAELYSAVNKVGLLFFINQDGKIHEHTHIHTHIHTHVRHHPHPNAHTHTHRVHRCFQK